MEGVVILYGESFGFTFLYINIEGCREGGVCFEPEDDNMLQWLKKHKYIVFYVQLMLFFCNFATILGILRPISLIFS